jgi:hypothetical protein
MKNFKLFSTFVNENYFFSNKSNVATSRSFNEFLKNYYANNNKFNQIINDFLGDADISAMFIQWERMYKDFLETTNLSPDFIRSFKLSSYLNNEYEDIFMENNVPVTSFTIFGWCDTDTLALDVAFSKEQNATYSIMMKNDNNYFTFYYRKTEGRTSRIIENIELLKCNILEISKKSKIDDIFEKFEEAINK